MISTRRARVALALVSNFRSPGSIVLLVLIFSGFRSPTLGVAQSLPISVEPEWGIGRSSALRIFASYEKRDYKGFRTLDAGETVEFELIDGEKGPKAQRVVRPMAIGVGSGNGAPSEAPDSLNGDHRSPADAPTFTDQIKTKLSRRLFGG